MRVVQTRNKGLVFGILLSALLVGVMLTMGQIPLAVSQPVTIPVGSISGPIPMDAANPVWETVPGIVVPLSGQTITTPMHPNISVKTVMVKMATNGKEIGVWANWGDQTLNNTTIGPQDFRDLITPVVTQNSKRFKSAMRAMLEASQPLGIAADLLKHPLE